MGIEGKTIVFTGKISRPRHEFEDLVRQHGGTSGSSVSKNTDYLVVGEKPGSKLMKATMLGIKTISERDFVKLLQNNEEISDEVSLTSEEPEDQIEAAYRYRTKIIALNGFLDHPHLALLKCSWCGLNYQQWDDLPNHETCPVCEILLPIPLCPHCNNNPIYVEDFGMYYCMPCGTWFKAPYSIHARHTAHIHMWYKETETSKRTVKECPCGATLTFPNDYPEHPFIKYEPSYIRERARKDVQRWRQEQERIWGERQERSKRKEQEALKFIQSLTEEQINQLEEQLSNGRC